MAEALGTLVRVDRMGSVVVLVLVHPPANLWRAEMEAPLTAGLQAALADPGVSAVILRGEGRGFSAGRALDAALDAAAQEALTRVCARIEASPKPVIAAIHGMALGAGCALALAAHWRIAHESAMFSLPEVSLGLIPGAGATQRLPRLIGAEAALRVMLEARPLSAAEALALGLVDEVSTGVLGQAALAMAARASDGRASDGRASDGRGLAPRPTSAMMPRDLGRLTGLVEAARVAVAASPLPAPLRLIDCVEAAGLLPFDMGVNLEAAAFGDLSATPEAAGLVHALRAERIALEPPRELAGQVAPEVRLIGILGAQGFAADLSLQAVRAGLEVVLVDPDRAALTAALATVVGALDAEVAAGRLTEPLREAAWARMAAGQGALPQGLDLVFVAPGVEPAPDQVVLGASVRGLGLTLAETLGGLAELSIGPGADLVTLARAAALGRRLGWRVVTVGPGGPLELGLRLALEAAVEALAPVLGETVVRQALAAAGIGEPPLGPMPPQGATVVRAALAALAAESARMLHDGRARRPADIDAIAVLSGLMPRWLGGPLHQADRRGALVLRADLRKLGAAPVFGVSPWIDRLIAQGKGFGL
ncbi:enoyl-CoA hydratase-related protein [Rhodobacter sp. KR11]|uniref:enoyl-CoA hydratase/isomerase family protein n=1 Tax=Rhodobacter sp. KR11 TaxID=2974588 RepID=UPI002221ABA8|nr:enoyl-CoA hydratase/isomerase family protein [Rhodobacter sp. KR11]MCW1919337.1 enoyl-CoA hydratase-related protein [Rhodobacter sp. KR11]